MGKVYELSEEEDRARRVLVALTRYLGVSGRELARRCHYSPQTASDKMSGVNRIRLDDLGRFYRAFGVPMHVFLEEPADAVRWVLDNTAGEDGMAELPFLLSVVGAFVAALVSARQPALGMWLAENQRDDDVMSGADAASLSGDPFTDIWGFPPPLARITTHNGAQFRVRMCSAHTHASGPKANAYAPECVGARRAGGVGPRACRTGQREPGPAGRAEGVAQVFP